MTDNIYYQKYLKYKAKYLELKFQIGRGTNSQTKEQNNVELLNLQNIKETKMTELSQLTYTPKDYLGWTSANKNSIERIRNYGFFKFFPYLAVIDSLINENFVEPIDLLAKELLNNGFKKFILGQLRVSANGVSLIFNSDAFKKFSNKVKNSIVENKTLKSTLSAFVLRSDIDTQFNAKKFTLDANDYDIPLKTLLFDINQKLKGQIK